METHSHAQWLCTLRTGSHMNPDALTDQFDLYLAVLETGSFSAANWPALIWAWRTV